MNKPAWQFWIDRGGTFTDVIGRAPDGCLHVRKLLSDDPKFYDDAAAEGVRRVLAEAGGETRVSEIRMGTTVATNALLERKGATTGLILTRGLGDALRIGEQDRPRLFDLHIRKASALFAATAEADERLAADGSVLQPLDIRALEETLDTWRAEGIKSVAVCLLHGWLNPLHEQQVADLARAKGFAHVSASHEVSALIKYVARAGTTVADAYLSPVLLNYVAGFREALASAGIECERVYFMQSNGGLVSADQFRGKDAILSGPAGGVIGMRAAGRLTDTTNLIGFDMGGTSTDVSVCAGEPEIVNDTEISGVHIRTPMIRIHTIAAGGGSVLSYTRGRFTVGPESAGANPGPMSYGRGGPLTLTDANVLLGRIQPEHFPRVFGSDGKQALDADAVRAAFDEQAQTIATESGTRFTAEQTAEGFLRVAIENMANALRHISVSRGLDPADYTLCCFGGAGAQHACRVADSLGMARILLDPQAGVLSAWGMGAAVLRSYRQRSIDQPFTPTALAQLQPVARQQVIACSEELRDQGGTEIRSRVLLELKAANTDTTLTIELMEIDDMRAEFARAYTRRFGFSPDTSRLHIDSLRVEAESGSDATASAKWIADDARAQSTAPVYLDGRWRDTPVHDRRTLRPGTTVEGPAIITEVNSTTVLETGWTAAVNDKLQLLLTRTTVRADGFRGIAAADSVDPVLLEIINNHFVYIADEMGTVLRKTAQSVNIRERLDFSCALFTAQGDLIANAPHVPVHLGSMDDSVKSALEHRGKELRDGCVILTNAPYNGGTHLPDITAISPVLNNVGKLCFLVASRAHHADIGGISPGSMPPFSRHINEEGVLFDNFVVVRDGALQEAELTACLNDGAWPARNPAQNIADFYAQIAANRTGIQLLLDMLAQYGDAVVSTYAEHVQTNAEESVREIISRLGEGSFTYQLDNGQQISVAVSIDRAARSATIDFTGTSPAADNNLNAPKAVCQAAVMYVFRTLVQSDIPLNAGCRKPLQLIIPEGSMLNPVYPAAVVGGNVETSQCVTDALYGALGVLAGSQGTMNNLSFGNERFQYYETIGGGSGAGPDFAGADAVQTHMTNTRITDPEVLETRYPVLLREFSVRRDSGGAGAYRGGNGVVRKIEFREAMSAAVLSNHREIPPFGLNGGHPGKVGRNAVLRAATGSNEAIVDQSDVEEYGGVVATDMATGDVLIIETPGGGGSGTPQTT